MRIEDRPKLASFSTLRLGGTGRVIYYPGSTRDLEQVMAREKDTQGRIIYLGAGSNTLFAAGEHNLALVRWNGTRGIEIQHAEQNEIVVRVEGNVRLPRLVGWCVSRGFSGLEPLAGIPGTVGGAVAMNAGSHGLEISEVLKSIRVWSPGKEEQDIPSSALNTGYREMKIPGRPSFLITAAWFVLQKSSKRLVKSKARDWFKRKLAVQPVLERTIGCIFKNMQDVSSGKVLDELGFRGRCLGGVCFSRKHANFLVHKENGSPEAAMELINSASQAIKREKGLEPELEIRIEPCP